MPIQPASSGRNSLLKSSILLLQPLVKPLPILPDDGIPHKLKNGQPLSPALVAGCFANCSVFIIEIFHPQPVAAAAKRIQVAGNGLLEINRAGLIGLLYATADDTAFLDAGISAEPKAKYGGAKFAAVSVAGSFCGNLVAPGLREVGCQLRVEAMQGFGFLWL